MVFGQISVAGEGQDLETVSKAIDYTHVPGYKLLA